MESFAARERLARWTDLRLRPIAPFTWLGPVLACLGGAWAGSGPQLDWPVVLAFLLADPLWGGLWTLIVNRNWFVIRGASRGDKGFRLPLLPYTTPGSPGERLIRWLDRALDWLITVLWPWLGSSILSVVVVYALALCVAAILGPLALGLTALALALAMLQWLFRTIGGSRGVPGERATLTALYAVLLPWLLGLVAQGALLPVLYQWNALAARLTATGEWRWPQPGELDTLLSYVPWAALLAALLYAEVYRWCLRLHEGERALGRAILALDSMQLLAATLLVSLGQPLFAGLVGLLLVPQVLLQPFLFWEGRRSWYLRQTQPFVVIGMLAAAIGVGLASAS
ncbi:MAG: hypothetical protein KKA73_23365 [Chloroflexi bacterium]|nr:hypothetical protein [Chloroflexota bacterium]MBU1750631.1 hypothetical protein [Chloroflexota bacterium]